MVFSSLSSVLVWSNCAASSLAFSLVPAAFFCWLINHSFSTCDEKDDNWDEDEDDDEIEDDVHLGLANLPLHLAQALLRHLHLLRHLLVVHGQLEVLGGQLLRPLLQLGQLGVQVGLDLPDLLPALLPHLLHLLLQLVRL